MHGNRLLNHDSLDSEIMLHWNAHPLYFADSFVKHALDDYFSSRKEKELVTLYKKKTKQYQTWKLISSDSIVLNRLRKKTSTKIRRVNR